jgi:hypothetical protein
MASKFFASLDGDPDMMDLMVAYGKMYYRQNIFSPFAVLRKMDLEGGKLN